jgi:hypothetical protein
MWVLPACVFFISKEENKMEAYKYTIIDGINHVFEEKANQFGAFRKVQWGDSDKSYLEIRKWRNAADGSEQAAKGYTFMTEEGPSELTKILLSLGYANTREALEILNGREDFRKSLNSVLGTLEDDYFDPKSFLGE